MIRTTPIATAMALLAAMTFAAGLGLPAPGQAHEGHQHAAFSAGEPGDPKKPARTVKVRMLEGSGKMSFEPALIQAHRGEQIRFIVQNDGEEDHEFILATIEENRKHGELMKKFPEMEHDDPNAKRVLPYANKELLWKFTKRGEFEFACLIPGHYEKGMFGKVVVK
jgi:uncharacterized cupredoxin-like copper-binding protein